MQSMAALGKRAEGGWVAPWAFDAARRTIAAAVGACMCPAPCEHPANNSAATQNKIQPNEDCKDIGATLHKVRSTADAEGWPKNDRTDRHDERKVHRQV